MLRGDARLEEIVRYVDRFGLICTRSGSQDTGAPEWEAIPSV